MFAKFSGSCLRVFSRPFAIPSIRASNDCLASPPDPVGHDARGLPEGAHMGRGELDPLAEPLVRGGHQIEIGDRAAERGAQLAEHRRGGLPDRRGEALECAFDVAHVGAPFAEG